MQMYDIIQKKKEGQALSKEELSYFVRGFVSGEIPACQASALLMAIYFKNLTLAETANLTYSMLESGKRLDMSDIKNISADKHSTGGVGDKTSLILAPMLACCGLKVAKMSGRSLGYTGGTIDKLESISGFKTDISTDEFKRLVKENGISIMSQTENFVPADKKLYALRDLTNTVDSIPLIASSIMSKKLASGAHNLVLDVKCGTGAFVSELNEAKKLAEVMVKIGKEAKINVCALITNMDEPLGYAVGNALEVKEAVEILKGGKDTLVRELCVSLGRALLNISGLVVNKEKADAILNDSIDSGKAYKKFADFIEAQGGKREMIEDTSRLPQSKFSKEIYSDINGYVNKIDCALIGLVFHMLNDPTLKEDYGAGIVLNKKVGNRVEKGEKTATLYSSSETLLNEGAMCIKKAFDFSTEKPEKKKLILDVVM